MLSEFWWGVIAGVCGCYGVLIMALIFRETWIQDAAARAKAKGLFGH